MRINARNPQKREGTGRASTEKQPATVALRIGETVDVIHHCWNEESTLLNSHINDADGRADAQIPVYHVEAVLRPVDSQRVIQRGERR